MRSVQGGRDRFSEPAVISQGGGGSTYAQDGKWWMPTQSGLVAVHRKRFRDRWEAGPLRAGRNIFFCEFDGTRVAQAWCDGAGPTR